MGKSLRIAFIANAVGLLHTGASGGVRNAIINAYKGLDNRGHQVEVLAPTGSKIPGLTGLKAIPGALQTHISSMEEPSLYQIPKNSFLANSLRYAQTQPYDFVINCSNDWLPYFMTPFFNCPLLHRMNVSNENHVVSYAIQHTVQNFPNQVAVLSRTQAEDVGLTKGVFLLSQGIELKKYPFHPKCDLNQLAFIGRITPEKGLEDAAEIARRTKHKLLVFGYLQNEAYFENILARYRSIIEYRGFLNHDDLVQALSSCRALICTHKWVEAFGQSIIEAMACGLPVISYRRGGPAEIIKEEQTGFLVEPDNIEAAVMAVGQIDKINRHHCRQSIEAAYSLEKLTDRYERWFSLF